MQKEVPFSQAKETKYPEPVHIALVKIDRERYNPITLAWAMYTSIEPPMVAISVGLERFSHQCLERWPQFVLVYPSIHMSREVEYFGAVSGRDVDKLQELQTPTQRAKYLDNVLLAEATANFECEVVGKIRTGDHTIFVGRIIAAHRHDPPIPRLHSVQRRVFRGVVPSSDG